MSKTIKKLPSLLFFATLCLFIFCPFHWSIANENQNDEEQTESLEELEEENDEEKERWPHLPSFIEKMEAVVSLELNYDYIDPWETENENSESLDDFYLGSVELELGIFFNEWIESHITVGVDDAWVFEGEQELSLDEAILTLKCPWVPFYITGGITDFPFGVFEDRMISGTITDDLYEVDDAGFIIGFAPDYYGLNISASFYEGQDIIENLWDFGTHEFRRNRKDEDGIDSFIANVSFEPIEEQFFLSVFYETEPGDGRRNRSIGWALTFSLWKVTFDAEYITAIEREDGLDGEENKENAWFVALAIEPLEGFELAARYEAFDDDRAGDQDEILDHRYSLGINYTIFEFVTFSFEYRHSEFEKEMFSIAADEQDEYLFQLAFEFEF